MTSPADDRGAIAVFLGLTLALSLPFWALAHWVQAELLPGLPVSGLMAVCPALAALALAAVGQGWRGARRLLARAFDAARMAGRLRWMAVILLMPVVTFLPWLVNGPTAAPTPLPVWAPLAMFAAFYVAGLGEELGWSAWLAEPMSRRWGELAAALAIGSIWAVWHLLPFLQADRGWDWIAWQFAKTVAVRVVMVRLYFGAGRCVFAVTAFHALDNVAAFSLPAVGAVYDPRATALLVGLVAVMLTVTARSWRRGS